MKKCLASATLSVILFLASPTNTSSQWVTITGPIHGDIHALIVKGENLIAGTSAGIFRYRKVGPGWTVVDSALQGIDIQCLSAGVVNVLAGSWGSGAFVSPDSGRTWRPADSGLTDRSIQAITSVGPRAFASARGGGFFSTDDGVHWNAMPPWQSTYPPYGILSSIVYSPPYLEISTEYLIGGTGRDGVFVSTDHGLSWTAANNGFPPPVPILELGYPGIYALAFAGTTLVAGTDAGPYYSTDLGGHWTGSDSSGIIGGPWCIVATSFDVFAGSYRGVFHSSDRGRTWGGVSSGLPGGGVVTLAVSEKQIFAGVFGNGVWTRPLEEMITSIRDGGRGQPHQVSLDQNYPNPFNPSTTIRYSIAHRAHVLLTVFNVLGEKIATLVNGMQEPGSHDVRFDAAGLASGAYFCRLRADGFVQTRQLQVLR